MVFDKLTWLGFLLTAFGWTLLLIASYIIGRTASLTGWSGLYLSMPRIAECAILTGLGLAIVGALHSGFGALNKFSEALLDRSGKVRLKSTVSSHPRQKTIVERGCVKDRAYVLYIDGSVEVETMLGRRIFSSLRDAQEFIA